MMAKVLKMDKKAPSNLNDYMAELRKKNLDSLDDAFSHYDAHMDDDHQKHLILNVFGKGMDEFYDSFTKGLEEEKLEDTSKLEGHDKGVKKALLKGMKAYLKKVSPAALKGIEGVEDEQEQYKILSRYMDEYAPLIRTKEGRVIPFETWVDNMAKDKKKKVSDMKMHFYASKTQIASDHVQALNEKYSEHLFGTYHAPDIAAHVRPIVEKKHTVDDLVKFNMLDKDSLIKIYRHMKKGKGVEDLGAYGISMEEEENKAA